MQPNPSLKTKSEGQEQPEKDKTSLKITLQMWKTHDVHDLFKCKRRKKF